MVKEKSNIKSNINTKDTKFENLNKSPVFFWILILVLIQLILSGIILSMENNFSTTTNKINDISKKVSSIDNFFRSNVKGYDSSGSNGNTNSNSNSGSASDLSVITSNPNLYPSIGKNSAKHTVVEFIDFQCPFCGLASGLTPDVNQYKSRYGDLIGISGKLENLAKQNKIKYVIVPMSFLGQESVYAAQAGICANQQNKFFEMHNAIFSAQTQGENSGKFSKVNLEKIANGISGIDKTKFKDCLENDKTLSDVKTIAQTASKFATGTPTFYVDGKKVQASWTQINSIISN